jgi:hypothetical protein
MFRPDARGRERIARIHLTGGAESITLYAGSLSTSHNSLPGKNRWARPARRRRFTPARSMRLKRIDRRAIWAPGPRGGGLWSLPHRGGARPTRVARRNLGDVRTAARRRADGDGIPPRRSGLVGATAGHRAETDGRGPRALADRSTGRRCTWPAPGGRAARGADQRRSSAGQAPNWWGYSDSTAGDERGEAATPRLIAGPGAMDRGHGGRGPGRGAARRVGNDAVRPYR